MGRIISRKTAISFLLSLFLCALLGTLLVQRRINAEKLEMGNLITEKVVAVNTVLQQALSMANTIASILSLTTCEVELSWQIAELFTGDALVRNILLAPAGIVSQIYPLEGNEAMLGWYFFQADTGGSTEAIMAVESGKLVLAGPFYKFNDIKVLSGRVPVFINANDGSLHFWGLVVITLNYPEFVARTGLDKLYSRDPAFEIWRINPDTGGRQTIIGGKNSRANFIERSVDVHNANWVFRVYSRRPWYAHAEIWLLVFGGLQVSLLLAFLVHKNDELKVAKYDLQNLTGSLNKAAVNFLAGYNRSFKDIMAEEEMFIADIVKTDGISVFRNVEKPEGLYMSQIYHWESESTNSTNRIRRPIKGAYDKYAPNWKKIFEANEPVNGSLGLMSEPEASSLRSFGIVSLFAAPVFISGKFWGFVLFEDHRKERCFDNSQAKFMRSAALLIATAIMHNEMENTLGKKNMEVQRALKQAVKASNVKSEFLARMSHEMLTPMNIIMGMTQIANMSGKIDKVKDCLSQIDFASKHLVRMISNVLDISGGNEAFALKEAEFAWDAMLECILNRVKPGIDKKRQNLTLDISQDVPARLTGDEKRLTQVIVHLLTNAIKFTPEHGEISLRAIMREDEGKAITLEIEVADNGIGILKEDQNKLFGIFEQGDCSCTREYSGLGIGLTLAKSIVQMMDGDIWVQSELGQGARFIFTCKVKKA